MKSASHTAGQVTANTRGSTKGVMARRTTSRGGKLVPDSTQPIGRVTIKQREEDLNRVMRIIGIIAFGMLVAFGSILYRIVDYDFSLAFATGFMQHKIAYRKDAFSQAVMHYNGFSSEGRNHTLAMEHFVKAAAEGESRAFTALALMFYKGEGVARNVKTAMRWFEKASMAGQVRAMSMLCFMHYKGHVEKTMDFLTAAKWCQKAANAGDPKAQYNLGVMTAHGQGLEQDYVRAYQWLTLAMRNLPDAALPARNSLVTKMTHQEVQQGQEAAREWRRSHRDPGSISWPDLSQSWGALTSGGMQTTSLTPGGIQHTDDQ